MSERKVLSKYYPPDFDPAAITRTRAPKSTGPKVIPVRLMAPFSMKCTACGEYIYKGRKFNARKETTAETYYAIPIYRFYIRCTRCSAEITFKTDPKNMDYECERGAKRNFEVWRQDVAADNETEEERLDRLEREEAERDEMSVLEGKVLDARREVEIGDALDEIRVRNARLERSEKEGKGGEAAPDAAEWERSRLEREDEELARRAFYTEGGEKVRRVADEDGVGGEEAVEEDESGPLAGGSLGAAGVTGGKAASEAADALLMPPPPPPKVEVPVFKRGVKRKKDFGAALGIKKKVALV